jgi:hypothetical protein
MTDILTIHLPVPVPAIKTISRWRVFLALFNPRAHFTTRQELRHQLCRDTEALANFHIDNLRETSPDRNASMKFVRVGPVYDGNSGRIVPGGFAK